MSARVLITGAGGFAGSHLAEACVAAGDEVIALSRSAEEAQTDGAQTVTADLLDRSATERALAAARPEVVYHLAGLASVPESWSDPATTLAENQATTLNVLEAVRVHTPDAAVVVVGSGEIYGPPDTLPVQEDAPLRPQNPYAVSKAGADLLGAMYADAHGLRVLRARAFNHAGPRQSDIYVVGTLARQVAAGLEDGADPIPLVTGSPEPKRDFTDVRDVVRAYRLLGESGEPGAYNVCSGQATSVAELVELLREVVDRELAHAVDPARVRAHEVPEIRGSHAQLTKATGWEPEIPLSRTLADAVAWWRERLADG